MLNIRSQTVFIILIIALLLSLYLSCRIGAVSLEHDVFLRVLIGEELPSEKRLQQILWIFRLPRVLAAILVGGVLAVCGAIMQGLFRNPLVDPGIVGVMSGASLFAALSIVIGSGLFPAFYALTKEYSLPIAAFAGGWIMTMILYYFSKRSGILNIASMLLIGIALGALTGALTGLLVYLSDDSQLRSITFWGMGTLAKFNWHKLSILSLITLGCLPILWHDARVLNALMLGENIAGHLGFDVEKTKKRQILLVALLVGVSVAFAGGIGFVGLVVPHIVRKLLGSNHRLVLPGCFLFGAVLLSLSDLIARTIVTPAELPIGILTAMIGAPFLCFLVWKGIKA